MKWRSVTVRYDGQSGTKTLRTKTYLPKRQRMRRRKEREWKELLRMKQ